MSRLDESIEALTSEPADFGLQLTWPSPRGDWCGLPIEVSRATIEAHGVILEYGGVPGGHTLVPQDVLWHSASNMVVLVIQRVDHRRVRCIGLVAPDTEEEYREFVRTAGAGTWCAVAMAWLPEWEIPAELVNALPTIVDLDQPSARDYLPENARARKGWAAEGKIDPDRPLSAGQKRFYARQRVAMAQMSEAMEQLDDEEFQARYKTDLPQRGELEKGEAVETVIPLEPPKTRGKIITYPGIGKRSRPEE